MAFIKEDDYTVLVRNEIKDILLENYSETKLSAAEQMAINQVKNYLAGRYDVAKIFSAEDDERNSHIVMIVIDCTLIISIPEPFRRECRKSEASDIRMHWTG